MKTTIHTTMKTIMKLAAVILILCINSGVYAQGGGKVYYSVGGSWDEPTTWRLNSEDGESVSQLPTAADYVVISAPVTIKNNVSATAAKLQLNSSLIIESGANIPVFEEFAGGGVLNLKGDKYPRVDGTDNFNGSVSFAGTFTLSRYIARYAHLAVSVEEGILTLSVSDNELTFNSLRVTGGSVKANNNLTVNNDFVISSNTSFVGGNQATITTNGEITNLGTLTIGGTLAFASTNRNQTLTLVDAANINKIKVDKSTTNYYVDIIAESTDLLTLGNNAIDLESGTFVVGSNITINPLSNGEFTIPTNAELRIAGGTVTANSKINVNGTLSVGSGAGSAGVLNANTLSLNNGGMLAIYNGNADITSFTVAAAVTGCTFYQEGGTLTAPTINIASSNATYTVKGGTMYVQNLTVNTSLGAISGGHTIINKDGANINTKKDFWDLTINKGLNFNQDLTVLRHLTVADNISVGLNGSAKNLTVGGNLTVGAGSSFNFQDGSLITLNGTIDATVTLPTTFKPTALKIDKSIGKSVILYNDVTLADGKDLEIASGTLNTGTNSMTVSGNVVNNGEMIGTLNINGNSKKISGTGEYGTIVQDVTTVNLGSNITANTYTFNDGKCNLNAHVMTLKTGTNGDADHYFVNNGDKASAGLCLNVQGGSFNANQNVAEWPIGTSSYYAPAYVVAKESATFFNEYITMGAVGKQHPCLKTANGENLPCYWTVKTENKNTCQFILKFDYPSQVVQPLTSLALLDNSEWVESDIMQQDYEGDPVPCGVKMTSKSGYVYKASDGSYTNNKTTVKNVYDCGEGPADYIVYSDRRGNWWNYTYETPTSYWKKPKMNPTSATTFGIDNTSINFNNCTESATLKSGDYTAGVKKNSEGMRILIASAESNTSATVIAFNSNKWKIYGTNTSATPQAGDICIIEGYTFVNAADAINNVGKIIFQYREGQSELGRLRISVTGCKAGSISGKGEIQFMNDNSFYLDADCSEFDANDESFYHFSPNSSNNYRFHLDHDGVFPNVTIEHNSDDENAIFIYDRDLYVRNILNLMGTSSLKLDGHNVYCGTLAMGGYGGANVYFTPGNSDELVVGDIDFDFKHNVSADNGRYNNKLISLAATGNGGNSHNKLIITGNIVNKIQEPLKNERLNNKPNIYVGLDLYNTNDYVELWFAGDENQFVDVKTTNFKFNVQQMVIDKEPGSSIKLSDKAVTFKNTLANGDTENKTLVLKSGEVIFDVNGQIVPLSTGGKDFVIPENATLTANSGVTLNVTGACTGITLGGVLNLNDGAELNDEGHFYYLETDQTELNIAKATFNVGTDFCPDPSSSGVIHWNITSPLASIVVGGGTLCNPATKSKVDIASRSTLDFNGADINFKGFGANKTTDFLMNAAEADCQIDGSKFFFDGGKFELAAATPMPSMVLGNTSAATVNLNDVELDILGNLTVQSGSALNAKGWNINFKGEYFTVYNNGDILGFKPDGNTVDFCGTKVQKVGGSPIEFYNATISNTKNKVQFVEAHVINNELLISEGAELYDEGASLPITVKAKYTNKGAYTGDGGIRLSNTNDAIIDVMSTGTTSRLIVDNTAGVEVNNPNAQDLVVSKDLTIDNGVLNMKTTTLVLDKDVKTVKGDNFDKTKMIVFESTDCGVKKIFSGNATIDTIVLPIGVTGRYAPAKVFVDEITPGASFTIIPIGQRHPSIVAYENSDTYPKDWLIHGPTKNSLNFYWSVESQGTNNFIGSLLFVNDKDDYIALDKSSEGEHASHYVPARLLNVKDTWDKLYWEDDTYDKGRIMFNNKDILTFEMKNDATISGDYTAGLIDNWFAGAFPGCVDVFVTVKDGAWNDPDTWRKAKKDENGSISIKGNGDIEASEEKGVPTMYSIVYVYHNVTVAEEGIKTLRTFIGKRSDRVVIGKVELGTSKNHFFGALSGTGTLVTKSGTLPRGRYAKFVMPQSGTIVFDGSEAYEYPITHSTFNNVVFTGNGRRTLGSEDLVVNGYLKAQNGEGGNVEIYNPQGKTWNIYGDFIFNSGKFTAPTVGAVSVIRMCGDKKQRFCVDEGFSVNTLDLNILEVDNSSYDGVYVKFPINIVEHVKFNKGVLNTDPDYRFAVVKAVEDHTVTVQNYNEDRFINGPLTKKILANGKWTFPVGNHLNDSEKETNRLGHFTVTNYDPGSGGSGYVTVRYWYMPHDESGATDKYGEGIISVDRSEYWTVKPEEPAGNATFGLKLRWDETSLVSSDEASLKNVCITNYDGSMWNKVNSKAHALTNLTGEVTTENPDVIDHTPGTAYVYTLAHTGALTFDWTGKKNNDWFDEENWSGHKAPQKSDFVMIGLVPTSNYPIIKEGESAEAKFIKLTNNAELTIQSKGALTVFTDVVVNNDSKLTLKAPLGSTDNQHSIPPSGSLIYYGSYTGKATFERYVRNCIFERMAIPVTGFNKNIIVHPAYDIYYANESFNLDKDKEYYHYTGNLKKDDNPSILKDGWVLFNNPDVNNIDSAYLLCSYEGRARAFSFTGNPMPEIGYGYSRTVNFTSNDKIENGESDAVINGLDGWNFIPNPFLSAVDVNKMEFKNVDRTVYVHDNVSDQSFCYQQVAGEQAGYLSADGTYDLSVIAAGQSFFVHANPNAAGRKGVVTFPKECLTHGNEKTLLKSGNSGSNSVDKIVFNTSGNGGKFQSVVYFRDDATSGFDSDYDAYLQASTDAGILNFYSVGPNCFERLMVNGLPTSVKDGGEIPLGYTTSTAGTYTLSVKKFTVNNAKVYLVDTENNTTTELAEGFATKIDVAKGTNNSRFKLVFELLPEPEPEPEPVVVEPVVVEPEPEVVEPVVIVTPEPEVVEPVVIEPEVVEPVVVTPEPEVVEPVVVEPEVVEPVVISNPEVIVPEVNQKNNGELVVGGDEVSEPVVPEPVTPEPVTPEPVVPEPVVPEPIDNNNQGFEPIVPSLVENVDVKVYPVPSNGPVNVELGSLLDETGSVQMILVNASGRVIITKTVYDDTIHLDLSHRAGVYILRLSTPSKTVVKRIIIQ